MWLLIACTVDSAPGAEAPANEHEVDTAVDAPPGESGDSGTETATPEPALLYDDGIASLSADDVHADFDGDGRRDVLLQVDAESWVIDPVPTGSVGILTSAVATLGIDAWWTATGDVDGDGVPDLVATRTEGTDPSCEAQSLVFRGPIAGALDLDSRSAEIASPACNESETLTPIVARDLDGDGADELLHVAIFRHGGPSTLWRLPDGASSLQTDTTNWFAVTDDVASDAMQGSEAALGSGDMDGDGFGDLYIGRMFFPGPVLEGDTLTDGAWLTGPGDDGACAGDVDGDGYPEVVLTASDRVSVVPGPLVDGDWTSLATWTAWVPDGAPAVTTTCDDVDGDGRADLILATSAMWAFAGPLAGSVDLETEPARWEIAGGDVASAGDGAVLICDHAVPECRVWEW